MKGIALPHSLRACIGGLLGLVWLSTAAAVDVDLDPAPQIPLRVGQSQCFLVNLSKPTAACSGTVSFADLPDGFSAEPREQPFRLEAGQSVQLVFKITCIAWGDPVTLRPKVATEGGEAVSFPEHLKTTIIRDQELLDKQPLDDKGLLFYYSFGDGWQGHSNSNIFADKFVGEKSLWNEGLWLAEGGVKGKGMWGANGDAESKAAIAPLNNVDHRKGTILFWTRKSTRINEIPYHNAYKMDYDSTWQIGPSVNKGYQGEGLFGANWTPQDVARRRFKGWPAKPDSDSFLGLRRYKAQGGTRGYLEATYLGLRQRRYTVRAGYDWAPEWRHVAVLWDTDARRLEVYLDGELASDKVRTNGKDEMDPAWYAAPWNIGILGENAMFGIISYPAEGGINEMDRDELYIYNRPLTAEEIQANRQASMGKVVAPLIEPETRTFHDSLAVEIRSLWSNPAQHYTLDGSEPGENSPVYDKPIVLTKSTTLKARSYLKGFQPSDVVEAKFESLGPDRKKPTVRDVLAVNDPNTILVVFDKKVERASAETAANYTLGGGLKIEEAGLDSDQQTVRLKTDQALTSGKDHQISVRGVKDASPSANVMDDLAARPFQLRHLPGLAAWWSFDVVDGAVVKDYGPNRLDGVAYRRLFFPGAVLVEGHRGSAIYLKDPGDFVDVSKHVGKVNSVNLDDMPVDKNSPFHTDTGSVALWVKAKPGLPAPAKAQSGSASQPAATKPGTPAQPSLRHARSLLYKGYAYHLHIAGGQDLYVSGESFRPVKVGPIADDAWHHVAFVFQNKVEKGTRVYVDGQLKATFTAAFLPHVGTRLEVSRPRNWGGSDAWLDGAVDEVMFFTRLLSEAEVGQLYRDGFLSEPAKPNEP